MPEREIRSSGEDIFLVDLDYSEVDEVAFNIDAMPSNCRSAARRLISEVDTRSAGKFRGDLKNMEHARDYLLNGWQKGAARLEKMAEEYREKFPWPQSIRRRPTWMDDGDEIEFDRLRNGQIDTMWRVSKRRSGVNPPIVRLVGNIGGLSGITEEQLFWSGAGLLMAADALEHAGFRTEIALMHVSRGFGPPTDKTMILVEMKRPSEPLRIDALAFAACHAGFFRTFIFGMFCFSPTGGGTMGGTVDGQPFYQRLVQAGRVKPATVVMPNIYSEHGCLAAVKEICDRANAGDLRDVSVADHTEMGV